MNVEALKLVLFPFLLNSQIAADKEELDRLYNLVAGSVVLLLRSKDGDSVDFGTGIVLFSDESRALIGVDKSQIKDGETITVRFHDSTQSVASVFLKKTTQKHAVLLVYSTARPPPVRFNVSPTTRQDIFMLGVVEKDETLGLMTGTVGCVYCILTFLLTALQFTCLLTSPFIAIRTAELLIGQGIIFIEARVHLQ